MLNTNNVELSIKYLRGKSLSSSQSEYFKEKEIEIIFLYFKVNLITMVSTVRNVWLTFLIRTMIELEESIKG